MTPPQDPLGALEDGRRPPWTAFRTELDAIGFRPSKTLGQNFLVDPNAARAIAEESALGPGARVLEIGAGCGFLTLHLAQLGLELLAVEIDERLLQVAQRLLGQRPNVRWLRTDALAGKHALAPAVAAELPGEGPWHVVSNLPYSISAPLLVVLSRLPNPPRSLSVLVQEEVARRIAARPGEPEWGALTARLALLYRTRAGRAVGPQLFWPRPRVASRVVHLEREVGPPPGAPEVVAYDALVDELFRHRRKQLLPLLAGPLGDREAARALLEGVGLDPRARPETLGAPQLLALSRSHSWTGRPVP